MVLSVWQAAQAKLARSLARVQWAQVHDVTAAAEAAGVTAGVTAGAVGRARAAEGLTERVAG